VLVAYKGAEGTKANRKGWEKALKKLFLLHSSSLLASLRPCAFAFISRRASVPYKKTENSTQRRKGAKAQRRWETEESLALFFFLPLAILATWRD